MSGLEDILVERLPHWPFVAGAYAAFFLLLLFDAIQPYLAARRLRRELAARIAREARRAATPED